MVHTDHHSYWKANLEVPADYFSAKSSKNTWARAACLSEASVKRYLLDFPGGVVVKNPPANQGTWV